MTLSITDEERWRLVDEYIASYTEEYGKLEDWYQQAEVALNRIVRKYHTFRGWKSLTDDEFDSLIEILKKDNSAMRELIRDRYVFEREIERRLGIIHGY